MTEPMDATLVPLSEIATEAVEHLLDLAFGADRFRRTAYLLRPSNRPLSQLCFALCYGNELIGTVQCWPVRIGKCRLVLVGPVAVHPAHQGRGIGHRLMDTMLEKACKLGNPAMVMIGDPEYYGRFGFTADATSGWTLPGPWGPRRLLARNVAGHVLPAAGMIEEASHAL
jgi:predicted N-acetyltransferase YhbS